MFDSHYGVAFDRDHLFSRGANPCLNIRNDLLKQTLKVPGEGFSRSLFNFIPRPLLPFVNIIHSGFDATHEREWRVAGDLEFEATEIKFIFCPEKDFPVFAGLQSAGLPALFDLEWLDRV